MMSLIVGETVELLKKVLFYLNFIFDDVMIIIQFPTAPVSNENKPPQPTLGHSPYSPPAHSSFPPTQPPTNPYNQPTTPYPPTKPPTQPSSALGIGFENLISELTFWSFEAVILFCFSIFGKRSFLIMKIS